MESLISPPPPWALLLGLAVPLLWGLVYHLSALREVRSRGGLVENRYFGAPDVLFGLVLALYFGWGGVSALSRSGIPTELTAERLLTNSAFMLLVWMTVAVFLAARQIPVGRALGLSLHHVGSSGLRAVAGLAMSLPWVWAINTAVRPFLPDQSREQAMVSLFRSATETGDWKIMGSIVLSGVVVAPWVEETIFRGYFYPVMKAFGGPRLGAFSVSALFAVSHGNSAAMLGLFTLALFLTLAYERYGSLWVAVGMHAFFNAISLALLYLQGRGWLPTG
jgi:membrane protease YdiL (CAAX protease family)